MKEPKGRLTKKQKEIKSDLKVILFMIYRQSGHCENLEPNPYNTDELIGGIVVHTLQKLRKEKSEDVQRAYYSLIR